LAAIEDQETAEALAGLGKAGWWLNDAATSFAAREQAYRLYLEAGDKLGGARMALHLGIDHCSLRDAIGVGHGWLRRAERLLDETDLAVEHVWLALWKGQVALIAGGESGVACERSASAADIARSLGQPLIETLAMAQEGLALVREGDVAPDVRLNPEIAAAVAGPLDDLDLVIVTCSQLMHAWEQVRDFDAIERWWAVLEAIPHTTTPPCLFWLCRIQHAAALMWHGAWDEAESELQASVKALVAIRGEMAAGAMVRLARLNRRRGRYEQGAALLEAAEAQPLRMLTETQVLLGWADLSLDQGDPEAGRAFVDQALSSLRGADPTQRMAALELLVHAEVAFGKHERAHVALSELHRATCSVATDGVRAATRFAEGMVALGAGVLDAARSRLEEAAQLFERARARSSGRASTPGSTGPPGVHRQRWWSRNANACTAFPSGPTPPSSARPARRRGRPHQLRRSALLGSPHAGR
jgi:tetratricopeptide (TPR) repeat protein